MNIPRTRHQAFTLIEMLVAIAIVAVLIAVSVVAIQKIRSAAAQTQCANHLKQVGLACHGAHNTHKRMPPAFGFYPDNNIFNGTSGLGTVFFHLLPHIDQHALYQQSRHQAPRPRDYFLYTANGVHQTQVAIFNCPADPTHRPMVNPVTGYAPSSYAANYLVFGNVNDNYRNRNAQGKPRLAVTFTDGASQTILFAEKYAAASIWMAPNGSPYTGGCHWAYFQSDCHNPFFAYEDSATDPNAVGPKDAADPRDGRFQVRPNASGGCNPCLPATGHASMNVCMADGSTRTLAAGIDRLAWWALVTPAGGEVVSPE